MKNAMIRPSFRCSLSLDEGLVIELLWVGAMVVVAPTRFFYRISHPPEGFD